MKNYPCKNVFALKETRSIGLFLKAGLLLFAFFISGCPSLWAQSQAVNIGRGEMKISEVLSRIEKQTEYLFVYDSSNVDTDRRVSVSGENVPVSQILSSVFKNTGVRFTMEGKNIVLTTQPDARKTASANINVSGTVTDTNGETVIGCSILLKGTDNGTSADFDGRFSLDNVPADGILVFSAVGYERQEVPIRNRTELSVVLTDNVAMLKDVVVVAYGTQKRENLTGAVSSIDVSKQLDNRPITDIARGLQGAAPGLSITTTSGALGTDPLIKIRGRIGSVNGNSSPLILVDNAEVSSLSVINPDDIESVSVLKDAASSSIYGARAAFGVVLITTKKAKEGQKFTVSYSNNLSWATPTKTPEVVSSWQGAEMSWMAGQRSNPNISEQTNSCFLTWNLESIERMKEWDRVYGHLNLSDEMVLGRDFDIKDNKLYFYRSWDAADKFVSKWAFQQIHNLSVNGTAANTSYNLSLGFLDQNGVIKVNPDSFERYNISFNTSSKINNWMTVRSKLLFSRTLFKTPYTFNTSNYNAWYYMYRWPSIMPYGTYEGKPFRNAVTETEQANMNERTNNYTRIALGTTINIIDGLKLDIDYTFTRTDRMTKTKGGSVTGWDFWGGSGLVYKTWTSSTYNRVINTADQSDFHVLNIVGNYNHAFGNHNLNVTAGSNIEYYTNVGVTGERRDLIDITKPEFNMATGDQFASGYHGRWSVAGFFARVNYNYKDKYMIEVNGRLDGSSRFPTDRLWGFFPSASAGWLISQEPWMEKLKPTLSFLKLRASYGMIGNQDVGTNAFLPIMEAISSGWLIGETIEKSYGLPRTISDGFTWEKVTTTNLGVDARFFKDRLGLSFDLYRRRTSDMITEGEALPSSFGASAPKINFGELTTDGWELALDFNHVFPNGLRLNATASVSDARIKYTKFRSASHLITGTYEGKVYGEIWGYETDRLFTFDDFTQAPDGKWVLNEGIPDQSYYETNGWFFYGPGDVKYKDLDGDGSITPGDNTVENPGDQRVIGNSTPRYEYGARLGLAWKNFDLDIFFQGVGSRQLWSSGSIFTPGFNYMEAWYTHQLDYWTEDNPNAFYPKISNTGQSSNTQNFLRQTRYLLDMSYLRLKNVTIGYTLPKKISDKLCLNKFRIYISGENLFEIDNLGDMPIDPETALTTGDGDYIGRSYPYRRTISAGLQLSL